MANGGHVAPAGILNNVRGLLGGTFNSEAARHDNQDFGSPFFDLLPADADRLTA